MKLIYVIDRNNTLKNSLSEFFRGEKEVKVYKFLPTELDEMVENLPDILVINEDGLAENENLLRLLRKIRADESTTVTPIVVTTSNSEQKHVIDILKKDVETVITTPIDDKIICYSVKNIMRLLNSNRTVSPLTGLPGNVQIQAEIKRRLELGKKYAMLYADLDNFKAYNDTYGFSKGDEIIKYTAKILTKAEIL